MISTNSNNLTLEVKASQLEKDLITTDRRDLQKLKERLEKTATHTLSEQFAKNAAGKG